MSKEDKKIEKAKNRQKEMLGSEFDEILSDKFQT